MRTKKSSKLKKKKKLNKDLLKNLPNTDFHEKRFVFCSEQNGRFGFCGKDVQRYAECDVKYKLNITL